MTEGKLTEQWLDLCGEGELGVGDMRRFRVGEQDILLAHLEEGFFALDDRCPHLGWRLSAGRLGGPVITCPGHASRFDVRDGSVVAWVTGGGFFRGLLRLRRSRPARSLPVRVDGGRVLVKAG